MSRGSALRRVAGNSLWYVGAEGVRSGLSFLGILYLSRTLTLGGMGIVEFGLAVFGVIQLVSTGGVDALTMRRAARSPRDIGRLAGTSLLVSWSYFLAAFAVLAVVLSLLRRPAEMRLAALLFGLAAAAVPAGMRFALVGRERGHVLGVATPLGQATFLALCVLGVRGPGDVLRVPVFLIVAMGLRAAIQLFAVVQAHGRIRFRLRPLGYRTWMRATLSPSVGSVARALMLSIDVLVLGVLAPTEEVAKYGIATKIPLFLNTVAAMVQTAIFPTVTRALFTGDTRRVAAIQTDTIKATLGVALPGAICLALVAEPLVLFVFTEKFRASVPLFEVLMWRFPLVALTGLLRTMVWAKDPRLDARIAPRALAVSVAGVLLLITREGTVGAAYGILLGEMVAMVLYGRHALVSFARMGLGDRDWIMRLALALAVAGGLGWLARGTTGLAAIGAALLAWGAASLVADLPYARRLWREMRGARDVKPVLLSLD